MPASSPFVLELIQIPREMDRKRRLSDFTKPSVQHHLPQNCLEESSKKKYEVHNCRPCRYVLDCSSPVCSSRTCDGSKTSSPWTSRSSSWPPPPSRSSSPSWSSPPTWAPPSSLDNYNLHWCTKIKDEVEKLAYKLNEEAERTERPIRRLSKMMYGSTCADLQVDVMGECLSSIKHVVGVRSVFLAKRLHAV
ncbi:uncharacterized protein TNCV_715011 [Trichonephila clavipes]|nr:uncharacterized protein TNCV_715011 [Trichonephila clavipes]